MKEQRVIASKDFLEKYGTDCTFLNIQYITWFAIEKKKVTEVLPFELNQKGKVYFVPQGIYYPLGIRLLEFLPNYTIINNRRLREHFIKTQSQALQPRPHLEMSDVLQQWQFKASQKVFYMRQVNTAYG